MHAHMTSTLLVRTNPYAYSPQARSPVAHAPVDLLSYISYERWAIASRPIYILTFFFSLPLATYI